MSSVGRTMVCPVRPWRRALSDDRCLPASVFGPVECCAFARLRSACKPCTGSSIGTTGLGVPDSRFVLTAGESVIVFSLLLFVRRRCGCISQDLLLAQS